MLYSQYPAARARQIIADALGVLTTIVVITIGLAVTAAIRTLGQFGRDVGVLESAVQKASRLVSDLVLRILDLRFEGDREHARTLVPRLATVTESARAHT